MTASGDEPGNSVASQPGVLLDILGTPVELLPEDPDHRLALAREWSRCLIEGPPEGRVSSVEVPGEESWLATSYALASRLTILGIRGLSGSHVLLHACGLSGADGTVLVLVARSGTGKTTAAVTLASAGLGYVTDETVAIDVTGTVVPYPKPLALIDSDAPLGAKVHHGPDELRLAPPTADLRLGRLVLLHRVPNGAAPPVLERMALIDGLLALVPQTSALAKLDLPLQRLCALADVAGGIHSLRYTEIADAEPLLTELLAKSSASQPEWAPLAAPPSQDDMSWAMRDGLVRRCVYSDAVLLGHEALIMVGRNPMRLSRIGLTIWEACADGATPGDLEDAVVEVHGEHPEASRLVREAVAAMKEAGALASGAPSTLADVLEGRTGSMQA